jgi:hypothetical protein
MRNIAVAAWIGKGLLTVAKLIELLYTTVIFFDLSLPKQLLPDCTRKK